MSAVYRGDLWLPTLLRYNRIFRSVNYMGVAELKILDSAENLGLLQLLARLLLS